MTTIGHPVQSSSAPHSRRTLRDRKQKLLHDKTEERLWEYYDHVEGISSYVTTLSNTADLVTYGPATLVDGAPDMDAADPGVLKVWESLGGEPWFSTIASELVTHLSVPGQAWMIPTNEGTLITDGNQNLAEVDWQIWSTFELRKALDIPDGQTIPLELEQLWRVWMPHPKNGMLPNSAVRRVADKAEILMLIDQARLGGLRSRLPAGVWPLPAALKDETTESGKLWADLLEETLLEPIIDPTSTAALIPLMVYLEKEEADILRGGPVKVAIDDPQRLIELEERTLRRLAIGIDAPVELITGMGDLNHWTAWLIREETYEQHLDPLIVRMLRSLQPWWEAILEPTGVRAAGSVLWRNQASAIRRPNLFETAMQLHDRFVLSDLGLLEAADRDENDLPSEEELQRRILQTALASPLALSAVPGIGEVAGDIIGTPSTASPVDTPPPPPPVQAASVSQLGRVARRLNNLDLEALTRMEKEAARQMLKLRRQLLDRIAAAAKRQGIEVGDPETLPARLGEDGVKALISGNLATVGDFDGGPFGKIIDETQQGATSAVAQVGAERDTTKDGKNRDDGVEILVTGLLAALLATLYRRPSELGETGVDGAELVPFHILREALDVAGGGAIKTATDAAQLIGNGSRTVDALTAMGIQTEGFQWVYGSIPRATFKPHLDLDGLVFERWDDERLRQTPDGAWVGGEYFWPQDHRGCRCSFIRVLVEG